MSARSGRGLGRRGLLGGVAALAAAALAKMTEKPVAAAHEGPLFIGFENVAQHPTTLTKTAGTEPALAVRNSAGGAGGPGVYGESANSYGMLGYSPNSYGVYGFSTNSHGVVAQSVNTWGLYASSPTYAGVFQGNVYVTGSLTVASGAKSAAVKRKDGSHARVYCQESPEPWFEDFGEGALVNGRAEVWLEDGFAVIVKQDRYLVFLTEVGASTGLYVSSQGPVGFEVRSNSPTARSPFYFRVVARRKDDVGTRLEKITIPDFDKAKIPPGQPDRPGR